jgi:hypothetical protein
MIDLRSKNPTPGPLRRWTSIDAIVLHQTATGHVKNIDRWAAKEAHYVVTTSGLIVWCSDLVRIGYASGQKKDATFPGSNGFNNRCVAIEIEGMYAGIEGDLTTFWKSKPADKPMTLGNQTIAAARVLIGLICTQVAGHGGKVRYLFAHRQSNGNKPSDPGEAIWKQIALPEMAIWGLTDGGEGYHVGQGRGIPHAWDLRRVAAY